MWKILPLQCPYCHGETQVVKTHCVPCGAHTEGHFATNEFAFLAAEDLHFLRIFLQFEGRIKDMEAPLGLSYPTIRTRITQLKEKLFVNPVRLDAEPDTKIKEDPLARFEKGEITYEEMLKQIKNKKREKK